MSKYVQKMKKVLLDLNAEAEKVRRQMAYNTANFQAHVAGDENAKLQAELNRTAMEAQGRIDNILKEAEATVRAWAEPSGEEIHEADLMLLNGSFSLSNEDLHNLLVKHQNNGTMVNAIAAYAEKNHAVLGELPTAETKLFAYDSFAKSAYSMIGQICDSVSPHDCSQILSLWGEPGNISQRMETALYGIRRPDAPTVETPKAYIGFDFKPLTGR